MTEVIVALSGYARAGKDAAAQALVSELGFERHGFADALRDSLYALNPIIPVEVDNLVGWRGTIDMRLAHLVDQLGWEEAKCQSEVRELLQRLGTDAGRQVLGEDIWVDTLFRRHDVERLVVPDCRFPNEADGVTCRGGFVLRIERPGWAPINGHASETALDGYPFDAVIVNDGTLADLHRNVVKVIAELIA